MKPVIKAVARIFHFISLALLGGTLISLLFEKDPPKYVIGFGIFSGVGFIISGLINFFLLKEWKTRSKGNDYKIWVSIVHSKLLIVLLIFTPLPNLFLAKQTTNYIRIFFSLLFLIASPLTRLLRESSNKYIIV